jgi:hypothetical protein
MAAFTASSFAGVRVSARPAQRQTKASAVATQAAANPFAGACAQKLVVVIALPRGNAPSGPLRVLGSCANHGSSAQDVQP